MATSVDPKEAANIANAIADVYKASRPAHEVSILSRATVPESPSSPNKMICFFITVGVAALISVVAGCFIEVILLFVRAAEGEHS
jgi:capsular polysaccharide biosynthesis protein